uniref:Uncharacterized protein n=1 Tax=Micromonas pusilla TaxID=38833 RepID=A0A6U0C0E1_MICPS|mmetsp:Transcript_13958/g.59738  ORF Transcript_13958/g.59738 Transcript_13958/m.59738 type:complete len:860 (+) Transcript_13958:563-3142(+)
MLPLGTRRSNWRGSYSRVVEDSDVQPRRRRGGGSPSLRRVVNQGVALLGRCFGRDDWALYTAFERPRAHFESGRGFVTVRGSVSEAAKRRREEPDPHRDDVSRFPQLDGLYDGLDGDAKRKLNEDVDFFCSLRTGGFSQQQVRLLRYRLLYMMFSDKFPSRPLDEAAKGLMEAVKNIDYNHQGLIKSFQKDPTRGFGSVGEFDKASRRLVLESWVRSNNKNMTTTSDDMEFLGGHPSAGMDRQDGAPALTRQIEMVNNSIVVGGVSMDTPEEQTPPPASRYVDTCPVHDLAGPTDREILDANGGLAPPKKIKEITRKLAPHTFGAVLTAPHDTDVVCLNSALNAQIGYKFFTDQGYDVIELDAVAYARFGSDHRRAVSVFGSGSTRWGAWLVTKEGELPFFVTTTVHAGSTWCGPYAHQGYGWGKDRVGDIKMQQANLERGLAGKHPMPLETSAFALFDFDPRRAQALVDELFAEGSPPWVHPTVRGGQLGGQMTAVSKRKVQEKADAARAAFELVRARFGPGSREYVAAKSEAERREDEADRVYNRGTYHWYVPLREAAERVRLAGDAASAEDRALARRWERTRKGNLENLKYGRTLQAGAMEAERIAALEDATNEQKKEAKRLRASADKQFAALERGWTLQARAMEAEKIAAGEDATEEDKAEAKKLRAAADKSLANILKGPHKVLSLWGAARAPGATSAVVAEFERARDLFRSSSAAREGNIGYRNVTARQLGKQRRTNRIRAQVTVYNEWVCGPQRSFLVGDDGTDIIEAAARDADVIYIALFRKWYAANDLDFDVDHPLALRLNFPGEMVELEERSRNVNDRAMKTPAMQEFLASSDTASALPSSAPVRDPAAA